MMKYKHIAEGLDLTENEPFEVYRADLDDRVKYPRGWLESASIDEITALGFVAYEPTPDPEPVESTDPNDWPLTRRQLRLGLLSLGLTEAAVLTAINSIPDATERNVALIEWQDADDYNFSHPLVSLLVGSVGLTSENARAAWLAAKDL